MSDTKPIVTVTSEAGTQHKTTAIPNVKTIELVVGGVTLTLKPSSFGTTAEIAVQTNALIQMRHTGDGFVLTKQGR